MEKMVMQVNYMHADLLLPFLHCKMISLVRSYAVWNIMVGSKAFCKSTEDDFDRIIAGRKGKYISTVSFYSIENKVLTF